MEEERGCDASVFTELKATLELKRYMTRKHNWQRTCEPLQNMDQFALEAVQDMDNKPHACEGISETKPEQLSDAADTEEEQLSTTAFLTHKMHLGAVQSSGDTIGRGNRGL